MITLKCKMCGGDLSITDDTLSVCECEYCGSKQTVPKVDDEKKIKLYERANRFRMANEFDKAATVYESIIEEDDTEAESYWGVLLCKYGIEYVDDPATGDKVPTCHRSSFDSIMDDSDFEMVMSNADPIARNVYREQAKQIEEIRKGIIEVSGKEEPYDIFICYKETDENGDRTLDSVIAQDVYDALTDKGYRVFFSRITLEDKLGTEYEPYIFAALNSAKIMLAFGTSYDYYNAVWVKNEWSRYLKIMAKDKGKYLIPCFKDIDAYDIPKEFAKLQAQDMGKLGAIQDLLRGIEKMLPKSKPETQQVVQQAVQTVGGNNVDSLLKRGYMALEDKDWDKADGFFEDALNQNAECSDGYVGKLLAREQCKSLEEYFNRLVSNLKPSTEKLEACAEDVEHIDAIVSKYTIPMYLNSHEIKELYRFDRSYISIEKGAQKLKDSILSKVNNEKHLARAKQYGNKEIDIHIDRIKSVLDKYVTDSKNQSEINKENQIEAYADFIIATDIKAQKSYDKACEQQENDYQNRITKVNNAESIPAFRNLINELSTNVDYKDSRKYISICEDKIAKINAKQDDERQELLRQNEMKGKTRKRIIVIGACVCAVLAIVAILFMVVRNNIAEQKKYDYKNAAVGDYVYYGNYKGQNIEWKVLAKEGNKMLVITKDAVERKSYNDTKIDITWEQCTLRKWLNEEFYNSAFNSTEQSRIVTTNVSADKNPDYSTNPGNATQDKVFLLSINEVNRYFKSDSDRVCRYDGATVSWWLRSPGDDTDDAVDVSNYGGVYVKGCWVDSGTRYVRPALWINLEP